MRYDDYGYPCYRGSRDYATAEPEPLVSSRKRMRDELGEFPQADDTENRTEPGSLLPDIDISGITG